MRNLDKLAYYFPYFFLGHLIGDYVLQNSYIAAKKGKDITVLGLHILLVYISHLLILLGKNFGLREIIVISFLGLVHLGIDYLKFLCKDKFCKTWYYYVVDQIMHIVTLILSTQFVNVEPFLNRSFTVVLSVAIFNGYFLSILVHFIVSNGVYKRDYIGYFFRMLAPLFYFFNLYSFVVYTLICLVLITLRFSKSNWLSYSLTIISTIILMEVML